MTFPLELHSVLIAIVNGMFPFYLVVAFILKVGDFHIFYIQVLVDSLSMVVPRDMLEMRVGLVSFL